MLFHVEHPSIFSLGVIRGIVKVVEYSKWFEACYGSIAYTIYEDGFYSTSNKI